jgi:hypothetical protein
MCTRTCIIRTLTRTIRTLTRTIRSLTRTIRSLTRTIRTLTRTIRTLARNIRTLTRTIRALTRTIRALTRNIRTITPIIRPGSQYRHLSVGACTLGCVTGPLRARAGVRKCMRLRNVCLRLCACRSERARARPVPSVADAALTHRRTCDARRSRRRRRRNRRPLVRPSASADGRNTQPSGLDTNKQTNCP